MVFSYSNNCNYAFSRTPGSFSLYPTWQKLVGWHFTVTLVSLLTHCLCTLKPSRHLMSQADCPFTHCSSYCFNFYCFLWVLKELQNFWNVSVYSRNGIDRQFSNFSWTSLRTVIVRKWGDSAGSEVGQPEAVMGWGWGGGAARPVLAACSSGTQMATECPAKTQLASAEAWPVEGGHCLTLTRENTVPTQALALQNKMVQYIWTIKLSKEKQNILLLMCKMHINSTHLSLHCRYMSFGLAQTQGQNAALLPCSSCSSCPDLYLLGKPGLCQEHQLL